MKKIFIIFLFLTVSFLVSNKVTHAYGECDQYGYMATYDSYSNTCSCISGYSFGKDFLGKTSCISDVQLCTDKYGYNAMADYSGSCKCMSGYGFGKNSMGQTQCISFDSMCSDQLGYNARYNSLYDKCECGYGYIIKNGQCTDGTSWCRSTQGIYSSYNDSSNKCECDSGYTLNDGGQCVKKQNNVYFTLKELDTDERKAIIKSDYDYSYYLISYNSGCYASSFHRYLNHQIVVNLGTDFYLDTWDKIVLQDDDEVCDITYKERVDSNTTLVPEEDLSSPTPTVYYQAPVVKTPVKTPQTSIFPSPITKKITPVVKKTTGTETTAISSSSSSTTSTNAATTQRWYQRLFSWLFKR
jgi:hypothetical protein